MMMTIVHHRITLHSERACPKRISHLYYFKDKHTER